MNHTSSPIIFKNKEWHLTITRNMPLWAQCLDVMGQFLDTRKYGIKTIKYHLSIIRNGTMASMFSNQKNVDNYLKEIENLCQRPMGLDFLKKQYHKFGNQLLLTSQRLKYDFNQKNYQKFCRAYAQLAAGLFLTSIMGRHFPKLLGQELKDKLSITNSQEIEKNIAILTYPRQHTPLFNSQLDLLKIASLLQEKKIKVINIGQNELLQGMFNQYYDKYSIIPVNFCEEQWTKQEILKKLKVMMKYDCKMKLKELKQIHRTGIKTANRFLKKINDQKITKLVKIIYTSGELNEYRKNVFCRVNFDYRPFFQEVARKFKITDWRDLWKLTPYEIEDLYFNNNQNILKLISQRKIAGLITASDKNSYRVMTDTELKEFLKLVNRKNKEVEKRTNEKIVKGIIANQGIVQGIVKVIISSKDFSKFNPGDILVTPMTTPDFVPLMKKAKAIVTDEGGLTCHAAIISRELSIPCVIGTKIATQVLEDGDLVEVDANKGIVRKLD